MSYAIAIFAFPLINIPYLLVVFLVTSGVLSLIKKLLKVNLIIKDDEDIKTENRGLVLEVSLFSGLTHGVAAIILWLILGTLFECVFSEWGLQSTEDYILTAVYFLLWNALSSFSHYIICTKLKFTFDDPAKARKLFAFTSITVGVVFWLFLTAVAFILNM